ncbi:MAG: ABC transporter ATP-binding protein [Hyphomicrobiaceae bacterium]
MLQIDSVSRSFAGVVALRDVSLTVAQGEVVGLIGPNGSGKTTLFNVITGLFPADHGRIRFNGRELSGLRPDQIVACGLARTFQTPRILHRMTVRENMVCAAYAGSPLVQRLRSCAQSLLDDLLRECGLDGRAHDLAKNLTLPEQRRLELVRTLVADPKLILLDEPAGGMTPAETEDMATLIRDLAAKGRTCIIIEHKIDMISSLCQRICVLNFGKVIADGTTVDVLRDEAVLEAYLGRQEAG